MPFVVLYTAIDDQPRTTYINNISIRSFKKRYTTQHAVGEMLELRSLVANGFLQWILNLAKNTIVSVIYYKVSVKKGFRRDGVGKYHCGAML